VKLKKDLARFSIFGVHVRLSYFTSVNSKFKSVLSATNLLNSLADFTFDKSLDLTKLAYDVTRLSPLGIKVTIAEQPPSKTYT